MIPYDWQIGFESDKVKQKSMILEIQHTDKVAPKSY